MATEHRPETEDQVAGVIRSASGPVAIRGGGTRGPTAPGDVLSTAGLTGITLYEPGALTLVARAGTTLREVTDTLRAEGQHLPFEPMDHRPLLGTEGEPTIGGVTAANVSGPRRVQAGAARDYMIGVRFVDGTGAVVKNGGRVMKNVTGYDLVKLMAGARGTLGVLTEVALKVLPAPAVVRTVTLAGLDAPTAVAAMAAALGSPFEVTAAARLADGRTLLRVEGSELSTGYRAGRLADLLARFGAAGISDDAAVWQQVRDVVEFAASGGDVWRISVRPSDGAAVVAALGSEARTMLDWGGGLVWAEVAPGRNLRDALGAVKGHATLVRGSAATHDAVGTLHPEPPQIARLSAGLRARFDPRGVLNPGLVA